MGNGKLVALRSNKNEYLLIQMSRDEMIDLLLADLRINDEAFLARSTGRRDGPRRQDSELNGYSPGLAALTDTGPVPVKVQRAGPNGARVPPFHSMKRITAMRTAAGALMLTCALTSAANEASGPERLIELVNDYRGAPHHCDGSQSDALSPLSPAPALARAVGSNAHGLEDALTREGYAARRVDLINVEGAATAESALKTLVDRYCSKLTAAHFADIGVTREGPTWRIVLAQPLLREDLADWRDAGRSVLNLVNAARERARTCGTQRFAPAHALEWNDKLASAARAHSRDMAQRNYFAHLGKDGDSPADRVSRHGYRWSRTGENIAAGQGSPEQVVSAWLSSPHHCANIMEPRFRDMGAAYAVNMQSDQTIYWTQEFGTPRGDR